MIVAASAFERQTKKCRCKRLNPITNILDSILLLDTPPLRLLLMQAIERGRKDLIVGCIGNQIAGKLKLDEVIEGEIVIKSSDNPISPCPHIAFPVHLESIAVSIARHVEPIGSHAFAVGC